MSKKTDPRHTGAAAREAARHSDGKFGAQAKPEDTSVDLAERDPAEWHIGPSSTAEPSEVSGIVRDWEDRLQCAEAVNEATDALPWDAKDKAAYLALDYATTDDNREFYRATILDAAGRELGTCDVPGYTFNGESVPDDFAFSPDAPDDTIWDTVQAYSPSSGMTIDVAKVRAYDWDTEQGAVLVRMSEAAQRGLANSKTGHLVDVE